MRQIISRRAFLGASAAALAHVPHGANAQALPADIGGLGGVSGRVILPDSSDYDQARRTFSFNPRTASRPVAIVKCQNPQDVIRTIDFSRRNNLELAVRSGGHDVLAASTCNGVVLSLESLNAIDVDANARTVTVGAGVRAGELNQALAMHGLAAPLGCHPAVGIGGLTLGGGLGWLAGAHGATCDSLISASLVTVDGRVLHVSSNENADLFWALKGGGGNFGVVTQLTFAARPIGNCVTGSIAFSGEQIAEFLAFYRDFMARAPRELVVEVLVLSPHNPIILAQVCYCGDPAGADRVLAPLRAFATPLADGLGAGPYTGAMNPNPNVRALFSVPPSTSPAPRDAPGVHWLGASVAPLSDAAIQVIVERLRVAQGGWAFTAGHFMHGATTDIDARTSALPRTRGLMSLHFDAGWGSATEASAQMAWVDQSIAAVAPFAAPTYINYLSSNDPNVVRRAYADNFSRLQRLKRQFDPENILRRNRNIVPA